MPYETVWELPLRVLLRRIGQVLLIPALVVIWICVGIFCGLLMAYDEGTGLWREHWRKP